MESHVNIMVVAERAVTPEQAYAMLQMQISCFADQVAAPAIHFTNGWAFVC